MTWLTRVGAINTRIVAAVPGTALAVGHREADANGDAPRVAWLPLNHERAEGAQRRPSAAQPFERAIVGVSQLLEVRLWGVDVDQCETLFEALVRACEIEAPGAWAYLGGTWAEVGVTTRGEGKIVRLTLKGFVTGAPVQTMVVTGGALQSTPGAVSGDGSLSLGDP